ncbi:MAG: hypothetical protein GY850_04885 [bacterium]|nr:hypothetical protein [bacterium]
MRDACYEKWTLRPRHLSGTVVDGVEYAVHQEVEVFYTPGVADWLEKGRTSSIQDGEIIVAVEYPITANKTEAQWIHTRVKQADGSWDGWFWSTTSPLDQTMSKGAFGAACISCHASADNNELVFLDPEGIVDTDAWVPEEDLQWPEPPPATASRALSQPHAEADPGFLALYDIQNVSAADIVSLPSAESDHVPAAPPANQTDHPFVTSDQPFQGSTSQMG